MTKESSVIDVLKDESTIDLKESLLPDVVMSSYNRPTFEN